MQSWKKGDNDNGTKLHFPKVWEETDRYRSDAIHFKLLYVLKKLSILLFFFFAATIAAGAISGVGPTCHPIRRLYLRNQPMKKFSSLFAQIFHFHHDNTRTKLTPTMATFAMQFHAPPKDIFIKNAPTSCLNSKRCN